MPQRATILHLLGLVKNFYKLEEAKLVKMCFFIFLSNVLQIENSIKEDFGEKKH